jgi:hypothetical protein
MKQKFKALLEQHSTVLTEIRETTNYELFAKLKGNRDVIESHIKRIRQSFNKRHVKECSILVAFNPNYEPGKPLFVIIDGQHRFGALQLDKRPISFTIVEDLTKEEILEIIELLNTSQVNWDVTNFMGSKSTLGNTNYILYKTLFNKYDIEHEVIYYTMRKLGVNMNHKMFKDGKLKFDSELFNKIDKVFSWVEKFIDIVRPYGKRYYLKALIDLYFFEHTNLERLEIVLKSAATNKNALTDSKTIRQSLNHLVLNLYNVKLRKNLIGIVNLDKHGDKYSLILK